MCDDMMRDATMRDARCVTTWRNAQHANFDPKTQKYFQQSFPSLYTNTNDPYGGLIEWHNRICAYGRGWFGFIPPLHTLGPGDHFGSWFCSMGLFAQEHTKSTFMPALLSCLQYKGTGLHNDPILHGYVMNSSCPFDILYQLAVRAGHPGLQLFPGLLASPRFSSSMTLEEFCRLWKQFVYNMILNGQIMMNFLTAAGNNNTNSIEVVPSLRKNNNSATLHAYGDENPDTDLVYAVGQDARRVTVAFCGSVTPTDFLTDANIVLRQEENVLKKALLSSLSSSVDPADPPQGDYIGIHNGLYEYLFKPRNNKATKNNNNNNTSNSTEDDVSTSTASPTNKFTEILQHVNTLFQDPEKRRTYKLYVTGHSLGGALATLFSYKIAETAYVKKLSGGNDNTNDQEPWLIPTPVTCVSIASPRVGELDFCNAFTLLERRGMLRHLRVANHRDPVTIMPTVSGKKMWAMLSPVSYLAFKLRDANFDQRETYRHTGMKLRLFKPKQEEKANKAKEKDDVNKDDAKMQSIISTNEKLYDITYSGAATRTVTTQASNNKQEDGDDGDNDDIAVNDDATTSAGGGAMVAAAKKSFLKNLLPNKQNMPEVSFHLGNAYCENLERVKNDLKDLKLNDLYKTEAAAATM